MPTLSDEREQRVVVNDPALAPLIEAPDEVSRGHALEKILSAHAHPLIRSILARARASTLREDDVDDVAATINLRLVRRLRRLLVFADDAISNFDDFVATLAYHTIYDFLRRRYPERTRLKNRVRYTLTHDPRLAMWSTAAGPVAGLREWSGHEPRGSVRMTKEQASPAMLKSAMPADALKAILSSLGQPIVVDELVALAAELWGVVDLPTTEPHSAADRRPAPDVRLESRQFLQILWSEIRALRAPQRAALLLHVRDADGASALALLVFLGVAAFDDVAAVLEISAARLRALWPELPLDDLTIAATLGITRQQVINLRKAARARLARRMAQADGERR